MKISVYIITILLVLLIGLQNSGGRYGSYSIFSWFWLFISIAPILIELKQKNKIRLIHIFYLSILVFTILIQPVFNTHPIFILAFSLTIVVPFIIFTFIQKNNFLPRNQKPKISKQTKAKCKKLISENKLENCFVILSTEIKDREIENTILALKQKWNQNRREKNMNLNTNEWLEVQNAKIVNELLDILK
jgi:hypothetical protein